MTVDEFTTAYPEHGVKAGTLRAWRLRGSVPLKALQDAQRGVTNPGALQASVTNEDPRVTPGKDAVGKKLAPWVCDGDHAYDILDDGFARGYPGDSWLMRSRYRTPAAIRRMVELETGLGVAGATEKVKARIAAWAQ